MPITRKLTLLTAIALLALGVVASPALARSFEGTVVAKDSDTRTFKLKQDEGGGTFRFKVTSSTTFEDLSGFGAIHVGAKNIEVVANMRNGRWVASHVQRSGGGAGGGNGGGGGNDDGPGHH